MRHKRETLEQQCVHKELSTRGNSNNQETPQTNKQRALTSLRVHMLQVYVHVKHVVVLVVLRIRVIISVIVNVPTYLLFTGV